jgi:hypothetical protein
MELPGECGCDDYCDYDPNRVWNGRERKARKQHQCEECGSTIEPRQVYYHADFLGADGPPWSEYKCCLPCHRISRDYGGCCAIGELREAVWECLGVDIKTGETKGDDGLRH